MYTRRGKVGCTWIMSYRYKGWETLLLGLVAVKAVKAKVVHALPLGTKMH